MADAERSGQAYGRWLEYRTVETGSVAGELADSWGAPSAAGASYVLLQPPSGAEAYLRLIEAPPVPGFEPLVTFGWTALEFCVQDVRAVAERFADSPFQIIGPPRRLDGMDTVCAMQARGEDGEILYFTQIDGDPPGFSLPRARCFVDRLFIHVLGASDMSATQRWIERHLEFDVGAERIEMVYTMRAKAFGVSLDERFPISTLGRGKEVCLQVDQLPPQAGRRPLHPGGLPPGIAMTTLSVTDLDSLESAWRRPPARHAGALYGGRRSVLLCGPDATLYEVVEES